MPRIVVFGAGLVARPTVSYLLAVPELQVDVLDVEPGRAARLVGGHPRGRTGAIDIRDEAAVAGALEGAAVAVSLVPYTFHPLIARGCLKARAHLVTASYVSPAMRELDAEAGRRDLLFLNELGLDPGIDHMEAMRIIDSVRAGGGRVRGFVSYCGGLPAPEANTNPFGYKFSWSPRGVLLASRSSARFLKDGREVTIPAEDLFKDLARVSVPGAGEFEGYPNRDSVQYREIYGIPDADTVLRGTLRHPGWCETMAAVGALGFLDQEERELEGLTYADLARRLAGADPGEEPGAAAARRAGLDPVGAIVGRLRWLGLFDERPIPLAKACPLDVLCGLMTARLAYAGGERDMIVLVHELRVERPGAGTETIVSTLVAFGEPGGDSAMSRTVGLPAAIAARAIVEGRIAVRGVRVPVSPEIYGPILTELERLGIAFRESRRSGARPEAAD